MLRCGNCNVLEAWLVPCRFRKQRLADAAAGRLWCRARSVQQGSGKSSGEGLGGFGAEPGEVQQGSGEVPEKVLGSFGAEPGQIQQGSGALLLGGFGAEPGQVQ